MSELLQRAQASIRQLIKDWSLKQSKIIGVRRKSIKLQQADLEEAEQLICQLSKERDKAVLKFNQIRATPSGEARHVVAVMSEVAQQRDRLEQENSQLRACHEAELGVCQDYCDVVENLRARLAEEKQKKAEAETRQSHDLEHWKAFGNTQGMETVLLRSELKKYKEQILYWQSRYEAAMQANVDDPVRQMQARNAEVVCKLEDEHKQFRAQAQDASAMILDLVGSLTDWPGNASTTQERIRKLAISMNGQVLLDQHAEELRLLRADLAQAQADLCEVENSHGMLIEGQDA